MERFFKTGFFQTLLLFLFLFTGVYPAITATVSGIVTDAETADPLSYANVILRDTQQGATTDERGYYVIQNVAPGEYTLAVSYIGYAQKDTTISVLPEENVRMDFQLQPQSIGGEEVVVTANRLQFEKEVETSKLNLSTRELEIAPAFVEADLFRTIQTLPGVISQNDFSAALVVRGGSPDENLILLDGIEVYNPYHFGGIFSAFNTDAIRDADFQSGGFPVRYGGRLSSVLEINTKEGDPSGGFFGDWWPWPDYFDISGLSMDISLLSSKAFIEGPLYEGGYFFSARRTYFDAIANLASSISDTIPNLPYYFYDLQWRAHSQVSQKHRIDFQGYIGADNLTLNFGDLEESTSAVDFNWIWGNRTQSLILKSFIRPDMVLESMVANSNYAFDVDFTQTTRDSLGNETENQFIISNDLNDLTFEEKLDWKISDSHRLQMGIDFKIFDFSFSLQSDESQILDEDDSPTLTSMYFQDTWQLNVLWNFQMGVRSYWYSNSDRPWFDFRGGFKYRPLEDTAIKGSVGTYSQFLFTSNQDDAILRIVDFWNAVPDYLDPQRAMHYILGVEQWIGDGHTLSLEGYYKPYMNLLDINPLQQSNMEGDDFISGTGLAYGAEAVLKRTTGKLSGWLSYSYLEMEKRIDLDGDGTIEKESGEVYPPAYHKRHILNLVLNYRFNEKNAVGLSWNWSAGQPYTPVIGKLFGSEDSEGWFQPYLNTGNIAGDRNSARFPSYLRGDISYTRQINWFGVDGQFKLQIINFTNHFNVLLYNWDHSVSPSEVTATSMFPLIPTFGVSFDI
jgi:hypothetical protein